MDDEVAVFLEDDTAVSPYWLHWLENALWQYLSIEKRKDIFSISLYRPIYSEIIEQDSYHRPYVPYIQPNVVSWGAAFIPWHWRAFIAWAKGANPNKSRLLGSHANRWDFASSWKVFALRYVNEHHLVTILPNLPQTFSFSTHLQEPGLHTEKGETNPKIALPLVTKELHDVDHYTQAPPFDSLPVYTIQEIQLGHGESFREIECCVDYVDVILFHHNPSRLSLLLLSLACLSFIRKIILFWGHTSNPKTDFVCDDGLASTVEIDTIPYTTNINLNELFEDFAQKLEEDMSSCLLTLDENTIAVDEATLLSAFKLWTLYPKHIIGTTALSSRWFVDDSGIWQEEENINPEISTWKLKRKGINAVSLSFSMFHRNYLADYLSLRYEQARKLAAQFSHTVWEFVINFLIQQEVKEGPKLIEVSENFIVYPLQFSDSIRTERREFLRELDDMFEESTKFFAALGYNNKQKIMY
eukprot:Lithocolla_globosa_v1_NODE_2253_length_2088_cov_5.763896.p1 type:complete len:470 gc:universal NODE_2253_length_2088_cov_5.763896:144-1553(+)